MAKVRATNPKKSFEKFRKRWLEAPVNGNGMREITYFEFEQMPAVDKVRMLEEVGGAVMIKREGYWEECVVMTIAKYKSLLPPSGKKQARMLRHEGILYRECV